MTSTILRVDDSGMSRRTLRKILEPAGYKISEAEDGITALEQYYISRPDLVLLDLTMSGMNGIEVLKKLREMDSKATVIVASADIQSATHELVREAGARAFINKPFIAGQVLDAVRDALDGRPDGSK